MPKEENNENTSAFADGVDDDNIINEGVDLSALEEMDEAYQEAEEKKFEDVPYGTYIAKVVSAKLSVSRNKNKMLKWDLVILEPTEFAKRHLFRNNMFMPENLGFLKGDLAICKINLVKLSDLIKKPELLEQLIGTVIKVRSHLTKKDGNEYENVDIKEYIRRDEVEDTDSDEDTSGL